MKQKNAVSVVCIAYNHEKWIEKTLDSVLLQSYEAKELIVVDNGSSDRTSQIIKEWALKHSSEFSVSANYKEKSISYCQLFNEMLSKVEGEFVVDLSGDDFLYPQHLELSVGRLIQVPEAAFVFSDANISEENGTQYSFYNSKEIAGLKDTILGRKFYQKLIRRTLISSPTVVFRTEILKEVKGYDSLLSYEDFDIQIRLTSNYPVVFSDHIGVYKRKHSGSLSANQYRSYHSIMLPSTLRVCEKIKELNRNTAEDFALEERVLFELKHALWSANFDAAEGFVKLADNLQAQGVELWFYKIWGKLRVDLSWLYVKLT